MPELAPTRILYMEDDAGLALLLQRNLQRRGYVMDIAVNGEEGLAKVASGRYDLLLVDYNMPSCGGIDVIRALSSKKMLLPTIMVTGNGNEEVAVEALKLGASDYIVKDVEMKYLELLPVVIERVLYQQQLFRERRQMAEAVRESEERYRLLVELSPDGIVVHADGKFVFINPAGARFLAASGPEQIIGKSVVDIVRPDYRHIIGERIHMMEGHAGSTSWIEGKFIRLDGQEIDVEVAGVSFTHAGRPASQIIFRDISERKLVEERLEHLALYDTLTGLPNRTLFYDRINQLLALAKRNKYVLALLYMDLDRFKTINDTLGHEVGDLVLKEAARRMSSCTRKSDTVARMGGDEFIGICGRITAAADAAVVADKIIKFLSEPFRIKGHELMLGASIGISLYPHDGDDVETLVNKADTAMYRIKEKGEGGYVYFSAH